MRVVCSYCDILYDLKPPFENDDVSHGICELCWSWVENNLKIEMESYLQSKKEIENGPERVELAGLSYQGI